MPIPITFSAPGEAYVPSIEDSVRYAVWLSLRADNVNRLAYSADKSDPNAHIRIYQDFPDYDLTTGEIVTPQQSVTVAIGQLRWSNATGQAGRQRVSIQVLLIEAVDSKHLPNDVDAPRVTPETKCGRVQQILQIGTLARADSDLEKFVLIDPYRTPKLEDGTYDMAQPGRVDLTTKPPDLQPLPSRLFPARRVRSQAELFGLDPVAGFVVTYGWLATYEINVANRKNMAIGGSG